MIAAQSSSMEQFVVYKNPSDFPGKFVVRRWTISAESIYAEEVLRVAESLSDARAAIPLGAFRIPRQVDDDPVIVEVWI